MDTSHNNMAALFQQLGLESSNNAIQDFFQRHYLPKEVNLVDAPFWTPAQKAFLKESLDADAQWVEVIDHLDTSLRR
ncbi:DUF2789 domain-containing protein [Shewanella yunxiaonensis]|uniref:DUF2789 domain-containing protein n=1 Tax=Shewanella yunxiaonensis TaxID=2829809 RepID=A0ABX7YRT8_9GAMM|nr:DUF2789 domain-containing protein [Shewanella yunxiaonensis]QUN04896.1 DUF2789 domain-containing protein [Shewanella yunxiaonensis]